MYASGINPDPIIDVVEILLNDDLLPGERQAMLALELLGDAEAQRRTRLFYQLALWPTIMQIEDALNAKKITHAFFKGAISDAKYYGDNHIRPTSDIDIFVEKCRLEDVRAVFLGISGKKIRIEKNRLQNFVHAEQWTVDSGVGRITIDIHHTLFDSPPFEERLLEDVDCAVLSRHGRTVSVLRQDIELAVWVANLMCDSCSGYRRLIPDIAALSRHPDIVRSARLIAQENGFLGFFDGVYLWMMSQSEAVQSRLTSYQVEWLDHKQSLVAAFMNGRHPKWKRGFILRVLGHEHIPTALWRHRRWLKARFLDYIFDEPSIQS